MFYVIFSLFIVYQTYHFVRALSTPGPIKWPVIGNLLLFASSGPHRILPMIDGLFSKYKTNTYMLHLAGDRIWMTRDRENLVHILKSNFANYGNSNGARANNMSDLLGHGI
eukprot:PhM_4_TR14205/c0_g1_i1/m.70203